MKLRSLNWKKEKLLKVCFRVESENFGKSRVSLRSSKSDMNFQSLYWEIEIFSGMTCKFSERAKSENFANN